MALEFNDGNFKEYTINNKGVTVIDFWAVWCGPCKMVGPIIEQLATKYNKQANIGKLDVDNNPTASQKFGIRSIPTVLYFKDGEIVDKIVGAATMAKYESTLQKHLAPLEVKNDNTVA